VVVAIAAVAVIAATTEASTAAVRVPLPSGVNVGLAPYGRSGAGPANEPKRTSTHSSVRSDPLEPTRTSASKFDPVTLAATAPITLSTLGVTADTAASPSPQTTAAPSAAGASAGNSVDTGLDSQADRNTGVATVTPNLPVVTQSDPNPSGPPPADS
jgi:hypothetical protein